MGRNMRRQTSLTGLPARFSLHPEQAFFPRIAPQALAVFHECESPVTGLVLFSTMAKCFRNLTFPL